MNRFIWVGVKLGSNFSNDFLIFRTTSPFLCRNMFSLCHTLIIAGCGTNHIPQSLRRNPMLAFTIANAVRCCIIIVLLCTTLRRWTKSYPSRCWFDSGHTHWVQLSDRNDSWVCPLFDWTAATYLSTICKRRLYCTSDNGLHFSAKTAAWSVNAFPNRIWSAEIPSITHIRLSVATDAPIRICKNLK